MPVPKFEEYKAPWELDADGKPVAEDDQNVDKDRLKKYIHGLLADKDRLQTAVTTITGERDNLKTEIENKKREGESEEARIKRENEELKAKLADAGKTSIETLKLRAALKAGLSEDHVDRLIGTTLEELEADAEKLKASFGGSGKNDEETTPRGRPRPLRTPGDPKPEDGDEMSVEQMLAATPRQYVL